MYMEVKQLQNTSYFLHKTFMENTPPLRPLSRFLINQKVKHARPWVKFLRIAGYSCIRKSDSGGRSLGTMRALSHKPNWFS